MVATIWACGFGLFLSQQWSIKIELDWRQSRWMLMEWYLLRLLWWNTICEINQLGKTRFEGKSTPRVLSLSGNWNARFGPTQFLKNLYLFENKFSGPIKDDIDKLFRLESLYLGHNSLTGSLPSGLWDEAKVRPLQWLVLHHNNLNGTFPLGMRLSRLRYCDLSSNEFEGTIPSDWPTLLMNMRTLYLNDNQITGSIPQNFSEIGSGWLKQIDFSSNKLTGRFPQWGNPIYYLTNIDIRDNQFTRDMPSSICSMSVFDRAEMVELRADCDICDCGKKLCDNCRWRTKTTRTQTKFDDLVLVPVCGEGICMSTRLIAGRHFECNWRGLFGRYVLSLLIMHIWTDHKIRGFQTKLLIHHCCYKETSFTHGE